MRYKLTSKYCCRCNGRSIKNTDYSDSYECAECGHDDWYSIQGIDRDTIISYLERNGWEKKIEEKYLGPLRIGQSWTKKGYDYLLSFDWLERLDCNAAMLIEEEQIQKAIYRIADAENIPYSYAADNLSQLW